MDEPALGTLLPEIATPPPGPRSRALAAELAEYESPNVTYLAEDFPVFWAEARGANVRDAMVTRDRQGHILIGGHALCTG